MPDSARIEDLRRRIERDPASIAFAQLAEEYRRAGQFAEAVATCRAGLALHPGYLSARVTLGRALVELNVLDEAQQELERVLAAAPENLAAMRGVADIHHRRGEMPQALERYKAALALARNDPDLEQTVADLERSHGTKQIEPEDGLSLDQMRSVFAAHAPVPPVPPRVFAPLPAPAPAPAPVRAPEEHAEPDPPAPAPIVVQPAMLEPPEPAPIEEATIETIDGTEGSDIVEPVEPVEPLEPVEPIEPVEPLEPVEAVATKQLERLQDFLNAVHAVRAQRRA